MGTLRIIGGEFGSRTFTFPDLKQIRPTPNKLRETIFNWLQFEVKNKTCLDLFAGSGSLGLEALSRDAKNVTFVDNNPRVINSLKQNLHKFPCQNFEFFLGKAENFILTQNNKFDIIFLDPPFNTNILKDIIKLLIESKLLNEDTILIIETEKEKLNSHLKVLKTSKSGISHIFLAKLK